MALEIKDVKKEVILTNLASYMGIGSVPYFGLLDDKLKQVLGPGACKAYVHDQYCYHYHGKTQQVPKKNFNLLVVTECPIETIEKMLDLIHQVEDELEIPRTKLFNVPLPVHRKTKALLFKAHKAWHLSGPMISLYTLLVRNGVHHVIGKPYRKSIADMMHKELGDCHYLVGASLALEHLVKRGYKKVFGRSAKVNHKAISLSNSHNSGICEFGRHAITGEARVIGRWYKDFPDETKLPARGKSFVYPRISA